MWRLPKLTARFCAQQKYPASDELATSPRRPSCWSVAAPEARARAPSRGCDGGPWPSRWPRCWLARPARRAPPSMHFRPIRAWSAAEMCWSRSMRRARTPRSEEHTSELQSQFHLVCRLLLEKKKQNIRRDVVDKNHIIEHSTDCLKHHI